nr:hypothetical protein [Winslowiella toletana]
MVVPCVNHLFFHWRRLRVSEKELTSAGYSDRICFNYMDFLSASCKKRWSFVDAIYGVLPIFGMVTRKPGNAQHASADHLKELALQIISTQVSDEINIARLITLAEQQQIDQLDILLPYHLSAQQLDTIQQEYRKPLNLSQHDDRLSIHFLTAAH